MLIRVSGVKQQNGHEPADSVSSEITQYLVFDPEVASRFHSEYLNESLPAAIEKVMLEADAPLDMFADPKLPYSLEYVQVAL
jgi:hypothetical protein